MNPFEQIQAGQVINKIQKAVDLRELGNDPSTILTKSELDMLSKAEGNDIEKGEKANIGDIHVWNGKKFKKQPNGKWVEVSEHGMTKNEHIDEGKQAKIEADKGKLFYKREYKKHTDTASKLSDKEHSDEEVGLKGEEKKEEDSTGITQDIKDFSKKFGTSLKVEKYGPSEKIVMRFNKDDQGQRDKIRQILHTDEKLNKRLSTIDSVEGKVVFHLK